MARWPNRKEVVGSGTISLTRLSAGAMLFCMHRVLCETQIFTAETWALV